MSRIIEKVIDGKPYSYVLREASTYRYAIIRHGTWYRTWHTFNPDTIPMQNESFITGVPRPDDDGKGDPIWVESNWWHKIERINPDPRSYKWARSIGNMWINGSYDIDTPYSTALAESLHNGGNFVKIDAETFTHARIVSFDYRMDTTNLVGDWFTDSSMYWKACMISMAGKVGNVANNLNVYFPTISKRRVWINKKHLEIFPDSYDYKFRGCNVYDGDKPLLTIENGIRVFHTAWKISTIGVVPPS